MDLKAKTQLIEHFTNARQHFSYSYSKVKDLDLTQLDNKDEELLETLESFSSRFARLSDLVVSKYLRMKAIEADPGFRGTVIDLLNLAEKFHWIDSAREWRRIRELRNIAAHEYAAEDYRKLYQELISLAPTLLKVDPTQ